MATLLRRSALATLLAMALMAIAAPAFAHHKDGHDQGKAKASASEVITEDNDSDGMPNTPDPSGDTDNAHPSGNDKSAEAGGSGNQGSSESTPDENGTGPERDHEGTDKPGNGGGVDKLDQDGNNGCGNDDDFEDDNEGNCGGKAKAKPPKPPKTDKPKPPKTDTPKPPKTDTPTGSTGNCGNGNGNGGADGAGQGNGNGNTCDKDDDETPVVPSGKPTTKPPTIVSDASTQGDDRPVRPAGGPATGPAEAAPAVAVADGELAFTGVDFTTLLIVMALLGLLGAALVLAGRRHSRA